MRRDSKRFSWKEEILTDDHKQKVRTNKFSIGGLIGVHASIIVKWDYQDNFKPVYLFTFFNEKISFAQKHVTSKNQLIKNKNKLTLNSKGNNFSRTHKPVSVTCFCAREIFSSKKNKQAWNCLDNLIILCYLY